MQRAISHAMSLTVLTSVIHGKSSLMTSGSISWELKDKKSSKQNDALHLGDQTIPDAVAPVEAVKAADNEEVVVALLVATTGKAKTPIMTNEM